MQIVPLPANARWADDWQRPLALIVCHSRGRHSPDMGTLLGALYGFTTAEARIAAALLNDNSLEEIAARGQVKVSTVRMQVKSMLAKAGCRRQVELVRLCAGLAIVNMESSRIPAATIYSASALAQGHPHTHVGKGHHVE